MDKKDCEDIKKILYREIEKRPYRFITQQFADKIVDWWKDSNSSDEVTDIDEYCRKVVLEFIKQSQLDYREFFVVIDDETDQSVSNDAFELLYYAAEKRLAHKRTTVIDTTSLQRKDQKKIVELAKAQNVHAAAIVLNILEKVLLYLRIIYGPEYLMPEDLARLKNVLCPVNKA